MAILTTRQQTQAGTIPAPVAAAAGGDRVQPGATTFLRVINGGGGSITVTVDSVAPCSMGFDHDLSVAVAAGVTKDIGPLPASRFAATSDGLVAITYSGVTTVTVEAVSV
jgi:hypothetical protein